MKGATTKRQKLESLEEEQRQINIQILSLAVDNLIRKRKEAFKKAAKKRSK